MNQPPAATDSLKEEEALEDAVAHLTELHLQLRRLRSALPRMFRPLTTEHPTPKAMVASFMESVQDTNKELSDFKQAYTSEESKKIFQKASESRRANPKGIKPWRARDDPDWIYPKRRKTSHK
ncbi:hypothetical protein QBC46DRAFT_350639 [Diplogelasinospora grovesii]|uniref:Uncharacterized protein n=1 Tax=Diplogelasinospora grovesii TaxID=303347 RepID=A0AAN6S8C4_9PEZI|nr:hypothetical protein QBC46DRAFT_350639 [Diplogelasinospora grovesii]